MRKIKRWWTRLKCVLTGGCHYAANELVFHCIPSQGFSEANYMITNHCVKCGKAFKGEIPAERIDELVLYAVLRERARRKNDG